MLKNYERKNFSSAASSKALRAKKGCGKNLTIQIFDAPPKV